MCKNKRLYCEGAPGGMKGEAKGTQITLPSGSRGSLVTRFALARHSNSASFLLGCTSLSPGGYQRGGFWGLVGHMGCRSSLSF